MNQAVGGDGQGTSTRPYLLRALHDWCTDNGFTPYIAVHVDGSVRVPMEYVKNNEIVLNVGFEATSGLKLGNEAIEFRARFGGVARDIMVPVDHVVAIYARENGQGMAFPVPSAAIPSEAEDDETQAPKGGAARGLHLASVEGQDAATPGHDAAGASGASGAAPAPAEPPEGPEPPQPPPPAGPQRPSLKRIK
ncbi:MAG: ClpXP protease specificity-enhancing factor [Rubrivivax sp. SCN 71-131]|jgi:stringent starvation protein B|nr:MAG: ClpXP protease specificity-enhancing factor [Rubrivivax sp. SCN 71-131]